MGPQQTQKLGFVQLTLQDPDELEEPLVPNFGQSSGRNPPILRNVELVRICRWGSRVRAATPGNLQSPKQATAQVGTDRVRSARRSMVLPLSFAMRFSFSS
jgi:hypothetical protein